MNSNINKSKKTILVSVVVPIYNSSSYLDKCIQSIIGQTYKNIEIILVDDGSTDQSLAIAEKYKKQDSRIKILKQKNSGGVITRRNGIEHSKGEYVLIEDSDDWLEKDLVEKCVDAVLLFGDVDIVKFGYILEPSGITRNLLSDGVIDKEILENEEVDALLNRIIYHTDCNQIWNEMVRRKLFDFNDRIFDKIVHKGEDLQINLQLFQKARKIVLLENNLYHYLNNPNGITNNIDVNKVVEKIAVKKDGKVDEDVLVNKTLSLLSGKIIRILGTSSTPKKDLLFIQKELNADLENYLNGFNKTKLNQHLLNSLISRNIINGAYTKNLKYVPVCRLLRLIKKI